jgi:hypothetical protein
MPSHKSVSDSDPAWQLSDLLPSDVEDDNVRMTHPQQITSEPASQPNLDSDVLTSSVFPPEVMPQHDMHDVVQSTAVRGTPTMQHSSPIETPLIVDDSSPPPPPSPAAAAEDAAFIEDMDTIDELPAPVEEPATSLLDILLECASHLLTSQPSKYGSTPL